MENAGGSQVPKCVADAVHYHMLNNYVQLGAGYEISDRATKTVEDAHAFVSQFLNATEGKVILGPSSSVLVNSLATAYGKEFKKGDEIVLAQDGHESNIGCWVREAKREEVTVKFWQIDKKTKKMKIEALEPLLNSNTRVVALTHVSNMLGEILPLKEIIQLIRKKAPRARVAADGVAYAAHRVVDVQDWGIDYYFYSCYKVYGSHMAAMYMKNDTFTEVTGPSHYFYPKDSVNKWELGGVLHEGCAGLLALKKYINTVLERDPNTDVDREAIVKAWTVMHELEKPLTHRLISFLRSKPDVEIIGQADPDSPSRVPTICFKHKNIKSETIAQQLFKYKMAIRWGGFHSARLADALGVGDEDGAVRVSLVHYNTLGEVEKLIKALEEVFQVRHSSL